MHSGTAYIVSNIILTIFWMTAASLILDNKYSKLKTILVESVIQLVFWYLFEHVIVLFSVLRLFSGILCLVLLLQYFHTDGPVFKLITALMIFISSFFSEIILGAVLPYDMIMSGEVFVKYGAAVYSIYLFLNFTFLSIGIAALRAYKQRYRGLLVERQWFLFFLFPLSQTFLMCGWWPSYMKFNTLGSPLKVLIYVLVNFLADAALIYMLRATASSTELRIRSEMLEDQVRSQENYYDQLASTYTGIRRMRHDIDNHIYAIQGLLENNETQKASEYIRRIQEENSVNIPFADCQNTVVSSYLEKKRNDLEEAGIRLSADIRLPVLRDISDPDLICIYGNLLDNAKDACKEIPDAVVTLKTKYTEPYLVISCENPIKENPRKKDRRIPELERGIGFTILSSLAEQYDGQFINKSENGMFYTELILKTKTGDRNA